MQSSTTAIARPLLPGQMSKKTQHLLLIFRVLQSALQIAELRGGILTPEMRSILAADDDNAENYTQLWNLDPQFVTGSRFNPKYLSMYLNKKDGKELVIQFTGLLIDKMELPSERVKEIFNDIIARKTPADELVIISPTKPSSTAEKDIKVFSETYGIRTTFFMETELLQNPLLHYLSPSYEKVILPTLADKQSFFANMKLTYSENIAKDLPRMWESDPVAKFCGFSAGDIIRTKTTVLGIGLSCPDLYGYRVVIKDP